MDRRALLVTVVPPAAIAWLMWQSAGPPWDAMRLAGAATAAVGVGLMTLARLQLGGSFSVTPQARQLVRHGLYRRFTHPVYVFGLVGIAGVVLFLRRPAWLVPVAALVPLQIWRARRENAVLERRFGDEYRAYRRGTWI